MSSLKEDNAIESVTGAPKHSSIEARKDWYMKKYNEALDKGKPKEADGYLQMYLHLNSKKEG